MVKTKKILPYQVLVRYGIASTLTRCWWESKMLQPLWNTLRWFLKKLNIQLPYDPTIYSTLLQRDVLRHSYVEVLTLNTSECVDHHLV